MARYCGLLTESGIELEQGSVIKEGRVVEIVREAKRLLESGEDKEFMNYLTYGPINELSSEEYKIVTGTVINESGDDILDTMTSITFSNADTKEYIYK